jgi:hypothetical protein
MCVRVQPREQDAVEAELEKASEKPRHCHRGRDGKENVLVEVDQEAGRDCEEDTPGEALAKGVAPCEATVTPGEDPDEARGKNEREPPLTGEVWAAKMLNGCVELTEENEMDERVPAQRDQEERERREDESSGLHD